MFKSLYTFLIISFLCISTFAQTNVDFLSNLNEYSSDGYNDIWGYVDQQGNEYALLGVETGTSIINVTDPENPVEVSFIPSNNSLWKDLKVHGNYAYVVTESFFGGLQIIDLSNLPIGATLVNEIDTYFSSCHNIFIDDGYLYAVGASNGSGIHILDLADPENPVEVGYYGSSGYVHDVYVWNDTVVACAEDSYDLVDVTDKSNPQMISSSAELPNIYAHSGWMTEDKRYFIATEEFDQRDITIWDLQDRTTWDLVVPQFQRPANTPVHNLFVIGNYAYISYYKEGFVVMDISDPENPEFVGNYDTYPSGSGTYAGAWGCYPFLPSGNILISDMQTGLYVLNFTLDDITPVELSSFTSTIKDNNVILNWSTSTETNNRGFEVQRSNDKSKWNTIEFVKGNGTTTEEHNYMAIDEEPVSGTSYYRLVQIDFDGTQKIHKTIEVDYSVPREFALDQNYPNPFNPVTTIKFSIPKEENVKLKVYNILGKEVAELINGNKQAGSYEVKFDAANYTSGIYIARLEAGNNVKTIKMTLMK